MLPAFSREEIDGVEHLHVSNATISLRILPSIGGKIISLRSIETGREFLLSPGRPYTRPTYGGAFPDPILAAGTSAFQRSPPAHIRTIPGVRS